MFEVMCKYLIVNIIVLWALFMPNPIECYLNLTTNLRILCYFDVLRLLIAFAYEIEVLIFFNFQPSSQNYMDRMLDFLSAKILETDCTVEIRDRFPNLLLLIVTKAFPIADDLSCSAHNLHQKKCIAFGKLVNSSKDILQ